MKNNRFNQKYNKRNQPPLFVKCECGGEARFRIRVNFPFGKKSKKVVKKFYKCLKCNKVIY